MSTTEDGSGLKTKKARVNDPEMEQKMEALLKAQTRTNWELMKLGARLDALTNELAAALRRNSMDGDKFLNDLDARLGAELKRLLFQMKNGKEPGD